MKKKTGRNEKCPCGSGQKYKNCCLRNGGPSTQVDTTRKMGAKRRLIPQKVSSQHVNLSGISSEIVAGPGYLLDTEQQNDRMKGRG